MGGLVENHRHVIGPQVFAVQQAPHHRGEKIRNFRRNAVGGLQAVHGRVKSAKNVAHGVH